MHPAMRVPARGPVGQNGRDDPGARRPRDGCCSPRRRSRTPTSTARSSTCSSTTTTARSAWCSTGPSPRSSATPLRAWTTLQSDPSLVFVGGPVEPDALIAIARVREPLPPTSDDDEHLAPLSGDLASADLAADPDDVVAGDQRAAGVPRLRRLGPGPARRRDRGRRLAGARPRAGRPVHRRRPTNSGASCCAASPAAWPGWPTPPTTSAPTERPMPGRSPARA